MTNDIEIYEPGELKRVDSAAPTEEELNLVKNFESGAHASNTLKNYKSQMSMWESYCEQHDLNVWVKSVADQAAWFEQVKLYLARRSEQGVKPTTVKSAVTALRHFALKQDDGLSFAVLTHPKMVSYLEGIQRTQAGISRTKKAQAFTRQELSDILVHIKKDKTAVAKRNRAIISIGVASSQRASNLGLFSIGDIETAHEHNGINLFIEKSKTDQMGEGRYVSIRPITAPSLMHLDPIRILNEWLAVLNPSGELPSETPLFPRIRKMNGVTGERLSGSSAAITDMLRGVLRSMGWDEATVQRYSSHSLRATFITLSVQAGVSAETIQKTSGHKSPQMISAYDRTSAERAAQTNYLEGASA